MKGPLFKPKYLYLSKSLISCRLDLKRKEKKEILKILNIIVMLAFRYLFSRAQPVTPGLWVPLWVPL